ncbi:CmcJ/NvfI family oxidoreductase [Microbacterium sp. 18062]|uniref:CmcJ/NvfI family oxidoreductase n=1 Tax=Microbacterium sp. 18062 TaxID=2681410 RepID=UPI00135C1DF3|nr:CmcJ/NvfI family oxidoreductase [Microbacterium sp. 18062]
MHIDVDTEITYYTPEERVAPDVRPDFNALPLKNWPVTVHDLRASGPTSLDAEGFAFLESPTAVRDFRDLDELDSVYAEEMEAFIREVTGATETRLAGKPGLRSSAPETKRGASMMTGSFVHADVSDLGAQDFLERYVGEDADRWRGHRFALFNVWRSFSDAPQDVPLGLSDVRSVDPVDAQLCDITLPVRDGGERTWETIAYVHNPTHDWYYASEMKRDEAYVFRTFDSGGAQRRPVAHSAFVNPTVPDDVPPRESVEIRVFALFED